MAKIRVADRNQASVFEWVTMAFREGIVYQDLYYLQMTSEKNKMQLIRLPPRL